MKRILSFLLSVAMIITMLPAGAFAAELETTPAVETQAVTEAPAEQETEAALTEAAPEETEAPETTEAAVEETVAETAAATVEDDFRAAVAAAEASGENLAVWDEITLTADLTINMTGELSFADYSKLVVPSGVTLTLNGPTVINGATLLVEEGGKLISNASLTIVAPQNSATFDMNGEFVNNGQLWVNEGATVNLNGTTTSWYQPIHVGFGGTGATSTLNINGTLTTYGYLNIADAGAPGVLNVAGKLILEKDDNGNGYLQAGNPVNVSGTLDNRAAVTIGNDAGTAVLTVASGGNLIVSDSTMWFDVAGGGSLVNNGTVTNNFYHIGNYGTFTNNGTLNNNGKIRNYATFTNNGTVNGNAPVDGVADVRNVFLAQVAEATASGENLTVWDEVILNEDVTINMTGELSFADYSKLVVPSGVTLTLNGPTVINGATLLVEEGGKLISNASLTIVAPQNSATFDMNGEFVNNGQLWVNEGATVNLNGTATSTGGIYVGFGGTGKTSTLNVNGALSTSGYLCISDSGAPGVLNVATGATLTVAYDGYLDNTSKVVIDGTVNLDGLFTTGAARDDSGNVVGNPATATVNGTVNGSEKSSIGVGAQGSVNVFGTLDTDGEVVMEKESALWVDGTVTMSGPVNVAGYLHVDFIDDVAGTGCLTLNGTTNVTGYLAVHDGGTLITGAASVLNILNNENGCGYLDNQGTVVLYGNMYLDGLFTTGAARDDSGNVVGPDATATNNGNIEASATSLLGVGAGGTMYNNGSVTSSGEVSVDGFWQGYPVNQQESTEEDKTMSFADFKAALANGYVQLDAKVTIEEDLTLNASVYIQQGGEIIVPEGVTLTVNSSIRAQGGKLTVEEGGTLVNNSHIYVEQGGTMEVAGSYQAQDYNYLVAEYGESTITGVANGMISLNCQADTEEELLAAAAVSGYKEVVLNMNQPIRLTSDLELAQGMVLRVEWDATLTVPSGVTMTVNGNVYVYESGIVAEPGATLRVTELGYVQLVNAYLHAEGATVEAAVGRIHMQFDGDCEILGVDTSLVNGTCGVESMDDLWKAVGLCSLYNFVEIEPYATVTVTSDLTIPANSMVAMYDQGELVQLIIPDGVTVTNCTTIVVNNNCQVWIQAGGTLDNSQGGGINDYTGCGVIVDGTLIENASGGGGSNSGVDTLEELKAAIDAGTEWIEISGTITVTENLTVPSGSYVSVNGGEIIVPNGVTLTMNDGMSIYGGALTVEAGGTAILASLYVDGTVTVEKGGSLTTSNMTVLYGSTVTGVDKSAYTLMHNAYTEADIREGLKITGYNWVTVRLYSDVTLTANLTIPEGKSLIVSTYWNDNGEQLPYSLTIPSGKTVTNNGVLSVQGTLNNCGKIVNNGELYIYGDMTGDGTITDNGHMDYARPVYSHADLVKWLSADVVPTYLYVWGEVTLEGDVTIPAGTQLIMEGSTLIVPDGVTVTMNGEMFAQGEGGVIFEAGSELINNNLAEAFNGVLAFAAGSRLVNNGAVIAHKNGTINIYGTYVNNDPEEYILQLYETGAVNGLGMEHVYYMADFADQAELQVILDDVNAAGYYGASVWPVYRSGVVELSGNITIPENVYFYCGYRYGDSLVLKSGAVLTNFGTIRVYAPGTLTIEDGAELINHGEVNADEGTLIYLGGDITITADARTVFGKGKAALSAAITPASSAKITWTLADGDELFATLKASGTKAALTAADVTGRKTVTVTASATLENGTEVSDTIEITIIPLTKQIALLSGGADVTGQTLSYDLANAQNDKTLALTAVIGPDDAQAALTWTSSDETVAAVADGQVTFTGKTGKVTITASATDGSKVSAKVTLEARELVQSISLLEGASELVGGKTTQLKVQDAAAPGKALAASEAVWSLANASDAAYVTVTAAGKVTTKAVPEKITVKLLCSVVGNADAGALEHTITVYPAVTQVDLYSGDEICTGKTIKLNKGESITLNAGRCPVDSMGGVTWEISDRAGKFVEILSAEDDVLVLRSTGTKGTVTVKITSTDGSKKSATVKLQTGNFVTDVVVSSPAIELRSGESVQLTATPEPADADNTAVVWSLADANDKQYVSVSASGKVTAKKGLSMSKSVDIVATAKDGCGAYGIFTFQLQPADPGALVIMTDEYTNVTGTTVNVDLLTGGSIRLKAKYFNTDTADVTWSGKKVTFSEADAAGYITATVSGKGTFTLTADDGSGKKATVKLKAANLSERIVISGPTEVASGKSIQLKATILPEGSVADKKVTWWIDEAHTQYATISSSGKLTAVKNLTSVRTVTVWAQAKDGNSEAEMYCVDILPQAQSLKILAEGRDATNLTCTSDLTQYGGTLNLSAEVFPADASQAVTWKVSGAKVLQQNADGSWSFTGKTGTATITATAADGSGKKASFKLNVVRTMAFMNQSQSELVVAGGKSLKLASYITVDSQATNKKLNWFLSGDTEVASLNASGVLKTKKVTEMKTLTVLVGAADGSGCQAEFTVYVYPATTSVKLLCDGETAPKQASLGIGETLTLEGISLPAAAAQGPGAYTWKLSSDKFAELKENADGTVTITGKAAGTVTVTCTAADGSGKKATLKIKIG